MQKLISVFDNSSIAADDLNEYLDEGWTVLDCYPFSKGRHFLIQDNNEKANMTLSILMDKKGLYYKGKLELDHADIPEGSLIITNTGQKVETYYSVSKK